MWTFRYFRASEVAVAFIHAKRVMSLRASSIPSATSCKSSARRATGWCPSRSATLPARRTKSLGSSWVLGKAEDSLIRRGSTDPGKSDRLLRSAVPPSARDGGKHFRRLPLDDSEPLRNPRRLGDLPELLSHQCPQLCGGFGLRRIVDVFARRGDVGVAHPGLNVGDRELSDGHRAEAMAEIMEAKRPQSSALLGGAISTGDSVVVQHRAR